MINRVIQCEEISAMPAANTAGVVLITFPRGYRYKNITLKCANSANTTFTSAQITQIEARMGGGVQRRVTGAHLDAINALNGAEYASQVYGSSGTDYARHLRMFFEEPWRSRVRNNSVDPNALGWKTGWLPANKPLQLAVSVAALGSGVTAAITAEAEITDDDDGQPNPIIKFLSESANANSATVNITNIDNGLKADDRIVQISAFNTTDGSPKTVATVRLEVGSVTVKQDQTINALTTELINSGMAPATANAIANAAHIVFDKNDALDDTLPVGFNSSLLKLGLSAASAATLPYVTQVFGMPNRS